MVVLGISKTLSWTRECTLKRGKGERVSIATLGGGGGGGLQHLRL